MDRQQATSWDSCITIDKICVSRIVQGLRTILENKTIPLAIEIFRNRHKLYIGLETGNQASPSEKQTCLILSISNLITVNELTQDHLGTEFISGQHQLNTANIGYTVPVYYIDVAVPNAFMCALQFNIKHEMYRTRNQS